MSYQKRAPTGQNGEGDGIGVPGAPTWEAQRDRIERSRRANLTTVPALRFVLSDRSVECGGSRRPAAFVRRLQRQLDEVESCGSVVDVHRFIGGLDERSFIVGRFCRRHLLCQVCAVRRGSRLLARLLERLKVVAREQGELVPYMLTATVRNGPRLSERFEHLRASWRAAIHGDRSFRRRWSELVAGGNYACEVKRGSESGTWHPHLHAVVLARGPLDVEQFGRAWRWPEFSRQWHRATGDSFVVECHPLDVGDDVQQLAEDVAAVDRSALILGDSVGRSGLVRSLCEVAKYALKFGDLEPCDRIEGAVTLGGRRMTHGFGCLHGVDVDQVDSLRDQVKRSVKTGRELHNVRADYHYQRLRFEGSGLVLTNTEFFDQDGGRIF